MDDYGKEKFIEIGRLSSMLPAYIRHCCRGLHDGTDVNVLDAYREVAYKTLLKYSQKYKFVPNHLELLRIYTPDMVQEMITHNAEIGMKRQLLTCMATSTPLGLPKRACLHCPKVSGWIKIMNRAGTINKETGERYEHK